MRAEGTFTASRAAFTSGADRSGEALFIVPDSGTHRIAFDDAL